MQIGGARKCKLVFDAAAVNFKQCFNSDILQTGWVVFQCIALVLVSYKMTAMSCIL